MIFDLPEGQQLYNSVCNFPSRQKWQINKCRNLHTGKILYPHFKNKNVLPTNGTLIRYQVTAIKGQTLTSG